MLLKVLFFSFFTLTPFTFITLPDNRHFGRTRFNSSTSRSHCLNSPTAECYGVFAQYRFRCVLGELGRFREGTGFREPVPGNRVPEPRDCQGSGFRRFRAQGFGGFGVRLGSIPEVWTEPVLEPGSENRRLRRFRVPEIPFTRFRK